MMNYDPNRQMQQQQDPYAYNLGGGMPQSMPSMDNSYLPNMAPDMSPPGLPSYRHGGLARFVNGGSVDNSPNLQPSAVWGMQRGIGNPYPADHPMAQIERQERQRAFSHMNAMNRFGEDHAMNQQPFNGIPGDVMQDWNQEELYSPEVRATLPWNQQNAYAQDENGNPQAGYKKGGLKKFLRKTAQIALPIIGGVVGGPAGAALGGALGGVVQGGRHKWKHALQGAAIGGLGAYGLQAAGGMSGIAGKLGAGAGSVGNAFKAGYAGAGSGAGAGAGLTQSVGAGMSGLDMGLLGAAGLGTLFGKRKTPDDGSMADHLAGAGAQRGLDYRPVRPMERVQRLVAEDDDEDGSVERMYFENTNPATQYMAGGGLARYNFGGRYFEGGSGGQDDEINARLSDGEYVVPADVVSSMGDGNNVAGAKKLDGFLRNVRVHKTSKGGKGLPPRAKSLNSYISSRR